VNDTSREALARGVNETPGMWFDRLDALYERHLEGCSDCNYDRDTCNACNAGGETGHSCNCSKGAPGDGGYGVHLRAIREEALRLRDGFRQDTRGRVTLERTPNGVLNIAYRAKLLSNGRETTVRIAIAAADVDDFCHLISSDLMEELDRANKSSLRFTVNALAAERDALREECDALRSQIDRLRPVFGAAIHYINSRDLDDRTAHHELVRAVELVHAVERALTIEGDGA
jgi:hypothetical protein